jgi:ATPase family AAA domain-containing protein 3A/B
MQERVALAKQLESINHRLAIEAELAMAVNGAETQREMRLLEDAKVRSIEAQVKLKLAEDEVHARESERRLELETKLRDEDSIRRRQEIQLNDELARSREMEAAGNELQRQTALQEMQAKKELEIALAKAEQERVTAQQRVQWKADARIREEKETEHIKQRAAEAAARAEAEKLNAAIAQVGSILAEGSRAFFAEYLSITLAAMISLVTAYFGLREATIALRKQILRMLGTPSLVRDTSRKSGLARIAAMVCCRCRRAPPISVDELAKGIILPDEILNRVLSLTKATRNARANMAPLRHVMFYGPPGTGKTLVAQQIARFCGLDYAIMSGGDIAPLGSHAISELNDLFAWAHSSTHGLVLFIDEAEAFLGSRNKGNLSENMRNVLSTLLHHTGAQSQKLMIILATNRPEDLDSAVTDRMDDSICFPSPPTQQRIALGRLYFHQFISSRSQMAAETSSSAPIVHSTVAAKPKTTWCCARASAPMIRVTSDVTLLTLDTLMTQAQSMSGRQIAKLMLTVQATVYGSDIMPPTLTADLLQQVVQAEMRKMSGPVDRNIEEPSRSGAVYSSRKSPSTLLGAVDPRYRGDPDGEGNPAVVDSLQGFDVDGPKARAGARKK